MWFALVPVILIEAEIDRRMTSVTFGKALLAASVGNILTTVLGIPLMWMASATVEAVFFGGARGLSTFWERAYAVTIQAPWLIPYESDLPWMIPIALVVFAVPCFIVSVMVEGFVNRFFWTEVAKRRIWKATLVSNAASYLFLALVTFVVVSCSDKIPFLRHCFESVVYWFLGIVYWLAHRIMGK
jgi:hypothetical protein